MNKDYSDKKGKNIKLEEIVKYIQFSEEMDRQRNDYIKKLKEESN